MSLEDKIKNAKPTDWVTRGFSDDQVKSISINARIAAAVKLARLDKRMTRQELANELGINQYKIAKWEDPNYDFSVSDLCKIATKLDIADKLIEMISKEKEN